MRQSGRHSGGELEAVEVRPRPRSASVTSNLEAPGYPIFNQERVAQAELVAVAEGYKLALLITRDQTSRDRADHEQPINLAVKGGNKPSNHFTYPRQRLKCMNLVISNSYKLSKFVPTRIAPDDAILHKPSLTFKVR